LRRTACRVLASLLCAAWAAAFATEAAPALQPCRVPGLRNEVMCGQVQRPLNPAQPDGVQIDVHYVLLPALARRKLPDPVFLLAGGPGQSAIDVAPSVLPLFTRLNNRRDIVFVDQRGTGRSAPLNCEDTRTQSVASQSDPQQQFTQLVACRDALQKLPYGDLRFFTTPLAMQDLDAVRRQLGAARINLVGASYGTRAALDYQRQFPEALRRSVLDGVAPPDMVLPESSGADSQAVLQALFGACEREPDCTRLYPQLRAEWNALRNSLPRSVTLVHPLSGRPETFTLTNDMLMAAVRGPLYAPAIASALPLAIHEAAQGRMQALVSLSSALSPGKRGAVAMGMHFSVVCAEDAPRMKQAVDVPGSESGGDGERLYRRVCAAWPRGEVPAPFYSLPPARSPVLLLSGGLDPATPPRHAVRVAQRLGDQARLVVVANAGHGVMGVGCMGDVLQRFIELPDDAAALALNTDCAKDVPRPPAFEPLTPRPEATR